MALVNYTDLTPFRFWCHKVLPLVYDDSLSYYELLCKVIDYLNKTMEDVGVLHDEIIDFENQFNSLEEFVNSYFDNLDVQEEINHKLDEMAEDGTLTALLLPYFDEYKGEINAIISEQNEDIGVLKARMDSFTNLAEGSTTGDAELIDARIGANGVTYTNAGDAIRAQTDIAMNDIMGNQNEFVKLNISDMFLELELGSINTNNGTELVSNTRQRSAMLPTSDTNLYVMYPYQIQLIYYDKFKQYAGNSGGSWLSKKVTVNTAYAYYRIILRVNTDEDMSTFLPLYISRRENNQTVISQINKLNADVTSYYPFMYPSMLNVSNGDQNSRSTSIDRIVTDFISDKYDKIVLDDDYEAYILYFNSSLTFVNSTGYVSGEFNLGTYDYIRIMVRNTNIGDFTGYVNDFMSLKNNVISEQHIYTIGSADNVAEVLTKAMKYPDSIVYIEPYTHDCISEWEAFYGVGYFANLATGRGLELYNNVHIIGRSGCKLECHYTGTNDYVMSDFSLFNNKPDGTGYTIENVEFNTSRIRYVIHDERSSNGTPYKNVYSRCVMHHDNSGSTWQNSRACIGGGFGLHGDVTVENCVFDTVTSAANLDSLAYHNSAGAGAQNMLVIRDCYCTGNSTIQIAAYGTSTLKSTVIISGCSVGSNIEEYHWDSADNMDIYYINNVVRS